ncbi:MAG TPA: branched-chain amino acid ABC transporter permease [Acetobacteraceae bacterium]|jgi:branched-chain amino acid transport system permease protein/neutral amino acid transport system permease protein|nr:branched-chain amino acid ABC transporter permease [Acetobacteraceae bacterium]
MTDVAQLILNGLMAGAILTAPAIGFTAIYAVLRFPNFAIASHATIGAFAGYVANTALHFPLVPAAAVAFLIAGLCGLASDMLVLRPLRRNGLVAATIASVALTIALENLVRLGFGNSLRDYDLPIQRDWRFAGLRLGPQQLEDLVISAVAVLALFGFLRFTRIGKAMRAVADNPTLAAIKGIDANLIAHIVNFTAMGLAGLGGMLLGLDTSIDPLTGFRALLAIFAAAVVGGLGSIPGAVIGALAVGIAEELSLLVLPPDYRTVVGFLAILLVLTLRPRGILGARAF